VGRGEGFRVARWAKARIGHRSAHMARPRITLSFNGLVLFATVAELADAQDLGFYQRHARHVVKRIQTYPNVEQTTSYADTPHKQGTSVFGSNTTFYV
jgi:hypothetical protein